MNLSIVFVTYHSLEFGPDLKHPSHGGVFCAQRTKLLFSRRRRSSWCSVGAVSILNAIATARARAAALISTLLTIRVVFLEGCHSLGYLAI